jgi:hypothetical protein
MVIRFIVASAAVDTAIAAKAAMKAIRALVFVIVNLPSKLFFVQLNPFGPIDRSPVNRRQS